MMTICKGQHNFRNSFDYKINDFSHKSGYQSMSKNKLKKIDDFYFAGIVTGTIGGIIHLLYNLVLLILGVNTSTFWKDLSNVFFAPPEVHSWLAQSYGIISALGMSAFNGVLISLVLKLTGKDYLYIKSITVSMMTGYFIFMFLYPSAGLVYLKHSLTTPYVALVGFTIYGVSTGFLLKRFTVLNR